MSYAVYSDTERSDDLAEVHTFSGFDAKARADRVAKRLNEIVKDRNFWVETTPKS